MPSVLGAEDGTAALVLREKIHLPEVVLSHKMRDFEAKTSANSLLADPLDNSLNRLTIEEKERVMARMQEKIQQITRDIDDNFLRIKDELDANVRMRVCARMRERECERGCAWTAQVVCLKSAHG